MKVFNIGLQSVFSLLIVVSLVWGCQKAQVSQKNSAIMFLEGAELQIETGDQKKELEIALHDILVLSSAKLKAKRYPDYQLNTGAWTLSQMISAYFVPQTPMAVDDKTFYAEVVTVQARATVSKILAKLKSLEF